MRNMIAEKIKKVSVAVIGAALLASSLPMSAIAAGAGRQAVGKDVNGVVIQNEAYSDCAPFRVEASTVPTVISTQSGVLYSLDVSSGITAAAFAVAFDSDTRGAPLGTVTYTLGVTGAALPTGKALSPRVFTGSAGSTPAAAGAHVGQWVANGGGQGKRYSAGLVVAASDAQAYVGGCYRDDPVRP
jgi:hypothetical protein